MVKIKNTNLVKKNIKILGAGIAGMSAGIILAKKGYDVEIFEKRSRIGSFFKKDIHSLRNYSYSRDIIKEYKKFGINVSNFYPIYKEVRFSPSNKILEIYSKNKPLFYNLIRGYADKRSLDNELFAQAKSHGVKFYFNKKINENNPSFNIIATGAPSSMGIAYGMHYKKNRGGKLESIYYLINNNIAPKGYIYLTPFLNEFSLLLATTKMENKEDLKKKFKLLRENNIIKNILNDATSINEIFGFVFFDCPTTAIKNTKLYTGEAAGFVDASSGFGTHYAIISGCLAAKSIISDRNYDKLWKKYFGNELKEKYLKRKYLENLNDKDYESVIENSFPKREMISIEKYRNVNN